MSDTEDNTPTSEMPAAPSASEIDADTDLLGYIDRAAKPGEWEES